MAISSRHSSPEPIGPAPARPRLLARVRRSAWAVMLAILAVAALASWGVASTIGRWVVERNVSPRLDRAVEAAADSDGTRPLEDIRFRGKVLVDDSHVVGSSTSAPAAAAVVEAARTGQVVERDLDLDGRPVRIRAVPQAAGADGTPVLVGVADEHPAAVGQMAGLLALAQLGVFVVLGLLAYAIARRSTRVVEDVFRQEDRLMLAVAHEIRSPLARLLVALDEGLGGDVPAEVALKEASADGEAMSELIDDLIEAARVMSGAMALPTEVVRVDELVERVAECHARGEIRVVVDAQPATLVGSPRLLRLAVSNLVRNSVRHAYAGRGGTVAITVDARGILVADDGPGIEPEHLAALQRDIPRGLRRARSGLGLALAGWASDVHGGHLELENAPGGGLDARLALPVECAPRSPVPAPATLAVSTPRARRGTDAWAVPEEVP